MPNGLRATLAALAFVLVTATTGCGQQGDLYLPGDPTGGMQSIDTALEEATGTGTDEDVDDNDDKGDENQ